MPFKHHSALICPIDGELLEQDGSTLACRNGHSYDLARQGYANLLLSQHKRSRDPGDSREMVAARHEVLASGVYAPLLRHVSEGVVSALRKMDLNDGALVVDAGCGEGYYLTGLKQHTIDCSLHPVDFVGFDISRWALQVAAKRFPATWLVASNRQIPLADASVDVVLDMFGFAAPAEFARVLKPGGLWFRVRAGERHLLRLRELAYGAVATKPVTPASLGGFSLREHQTLQFDLPTLAQPALSQLFMMTPHYFRAPAQGKVAVDQRDTLDVSADVVMEYLYRSD